MTNHTCKGMKGVIAEGEEAIKKHQASDPALAEHYEIANYGTCVC